MGFRHQADKLVKSDFFDATVPYKEKVGKSKGYGDIMSDMYDKTIEVCFLVAARSIFCRLSNDLKYRGGTEADFTRVYAKYSHEADRIKKAAETNVSLKSIVKNVL